MNTNIHNILWNYMLTIQKLNQLLRFSGELWEIFYHVIVMIQAKCRPSFPLAGTHFWIVHKRKAFQRILKTIMIGKLKITAVGR